MNTTVTYDKVTTIELNKLPLIIVILTTTGHLN